MNQLIMIGYGNPDRQDDGVAWHIVSAIAEFLRLPVHESLPSDLTDLPDIFLMATLQLTPEMAEILAKYPHACFIDAHTGNIEADWQAVEITPGFQGSPFTHHLTAQTCLELAANLYGSAPKALLVSVKGHSFGFVDELSPSTSALAEAATGYLRDWLKGLLVGYNLPRP